LSPVGGLVVGGVVGDAVGEAVGEAVGDFVGEAVGDAVGLTVTVGVGTLPPVQLAPLIVHEVGALKAPVPM
jgi:hypothetical protein